MTLASIASSTTIPRGGGPAARIEAAEGLIILARVAGPAARAVLEAVERLSHDPVPAVRFQIAQHLNVLYRIAPELMWQIIERISRDEPSRGVLQGLLSDPFNRLAGAEADRIAALTTIIFERIRDGHGAKAVREFCLGTFAGLYIWRGHVQCGHIIGNMVLLPTEWVLLNGHEHATR